MGVGRRPAVELASVERGGELCFQVKSLSFLSWKHQTKELGKVSGQIRAMWGAESGWRGSGGVSSFLCDPREEPSCHYDSSLWHQFLNRVAVFARAP